MGFKYLPSRPLSGCFGVRGEATAAKVEINIESAIRNVVTLLNKMPNRYKLFGVWWWPIKALLKVAGYGPDQLYMLGDYQDPETAAQVPAADLQGTLTAAFTEYGQNARNPHSDGRVEAPEGELITIWDDDAGI